jgi:hypothetical protein
MIRIRYCCGVDRGFAHGLDGSDAAYHRVDGGAAHPTEPAAPLRDGFLQKRALRPVFLFTA